MGCLLYVCWLSIGCSCVIRGCVLVLYGLCVGRLLVMTWLPICYSFVTVGRCGGCLLNAYVLYCLFIWCVLICVICRLCIDCLLFVLVVGNMLVVYWVLVVMGEYWLGMCALLVVYWLWLGCYTG